MKVDAKGRIVLPREVRERLGLRPGSEVDIHTDDGRIVVEPEDDPEDIIEDIEAMITEASAERNRTGYDELDPVARDHVDTIERQADE